ncbi:alpha/beta hydrolase [Streptomyces longispororuber]|uniref:alpha/beta hydrolase n=1 Tax=Streptomyces longispororuber TaxID=68230 RepID=UPI00210E0029|nr:alpha/beta hydrolase [Streptomyces longispororuber]MCQ4209897.1 alpha/beta hydrolase [Streptomyces longispororuber]
MQVTPPPFDPELAAALETFREYIAPGLTADDITRLRETPISGAFGESDPTSDGYFDVDERSVPGPAGAPDVSLLICHPAGDSAANLSRPLIYHTHGGGMVLGDNRAGLDAVLEWARALDAVVVSVEYRLAPEHPYPAGVEDVYAGMLWTAEHAGELGADPDRIVIAGGSAGGGLTAALALMLRDRKGPRPIGQVLMCPMLDDRNDSPSAHQMTGLGVWDRTANETGWTALLGERRGGADVPAFAAPARAEDLSNLPPAFIDVGSAETFRDETLDYAARIWRAGGVAELHVWPGAFHGYDGMAPHAALSQETRAARLRWLHRLLGA